MSFLTVKNIYKQFGNTEVLKGIDFTLEKGQVVSIIGSSGSGKTTLLRCLNFLEIADKGEISVDGEVIFSADGDSAMTDSELREKRSRFGLVFQSFHLFPQYTVMDNLMLAPKLRLGERAKRIYLICQSVNILLVFVGCIIFPAKASIDTVRLVNYVHDYLTIGAWGMYGIGLIAYSLMIRREDATLGFLGLLLMSFIVLSSIFFIRQVVDPESYVGASAVSEVYIINALFIYLVTMYVSEVRGKGQVNERGL